MFSQLVGSCPESFRDDLGMIRGFIYDVFELRSVKFPSPTVATALKKLRTFAGPKVPKIISFTFVTFRRPVFKSASHSYGTDFTVPLRT